MDDRSPWPPGAARWMARRDFLRLMGLGTASLLAGPTAAGADPSAAADFQKMVPADKQLTPEWIASLYARGSRTVYRGTDLKLIGMPIGGI
jgi:non-lysosomal glucosylceramidase